MIATIAKYLRRGWKSLAVTDILFKLLAWFLLAPAVGLLFQLFLYVSGREVLADTEIAFFLMHPIGWITVVIVSAAVIALFAIEIAVLVTVCVGVEIDRIPKPRVALRFVAQKAPAVLHLAVRVVLHCLAIALPFLIAGGAIFWWLATEHDINFYLSNRPPEFLIAVGLIGCLLVAMSVLLCERLIGWIYATPMALFEGMNAADAMSQSRGRVRDHRTQVLQTVLGWGLISLLVRSVASVLVVYFAKSVIWLAAEHLPLLALAIGLMFLAVVTTNFISGVFASTTLASCIAMLYVRSGQIEKLSIPQWATVRGSGVTDHLTPGRITAAVVVLLMGSALLGIRLMKKLDFEDRVQITAHRGGALQAPENTIAAVTRGIEDGADWIEIDVQESRDGVVVVVHDSDLMKVAGRPVKIWDTTADELRSIDIGSFFDARFSDQRVPTLEEVLQVCRGKAGVNIELKYYGHDQDLERKVIEIVERNQMASQVVVMSLEAAGCAKLKRMRPDWSVGLLTAVVAGDLTASKVDFLAVKDSIATREFVKAAHRKGMTVAAWTLNDAHSMSLMISRGVDNLITDRPALARRVLAERNAMSPLERLSLEVAYFLGVDPDLQSGQ
jgi:glycerophosphoryl diester phosphodiesterase